jgi:microcystin degradation protein MlrC
MRIAIGGISTESCTFSPLPTRAKDFAVLRGADCLARYPFLSSWSTQCVPLLLARAMPGGPVEAAAYGALKAEFLQRLKDALPVDGVYLELHGAMNVEGLDDAEGDWIAALREIAGRDCVIAASFDLHGNLSERELEDLDLLTAYRTAPHVDAEATRRKACALLVRCLRQGFRPLRAWASLPVALPGEVTSTEWEPGASLYAALNESDSVPGVLDASILVGYAWADEPRAGASVVVTATDRDQAEAEAGRLARKFWDARTQFRFGVKAGSIDECIRWARSAAEPCVFISDSGDNPTAGGVGDVPVFLGRLLALNAENALVAGLADAPAVAAAYTAGAGATLDLSLGGKLDPVTSAPLPVRARVLALGPSDDRQAVLQVQGVKVIVTQRRRPFHFIADIRRLGVDPLQHKIVVFKIGYLETDLKRNAPLALLALSPGAADQAIDRRPFKRVRRPMYPLDKGMQLDTVPVKVFGGPKR